MQTKERGRDKTKRLQREAESHRYKRSAKGLARVHSQFETIGRYVRPVANKADVKVSTSGHAAKDILRNGAKIVLK